MTDKQKLKIAVAALRKIKRRLLRLKGWEKREGALFMLVSCALIDIEHPSDDI